MAMALCPICGGTIFGGEEHFCKSPQYPFNVIMTDEDKEKLDKFDEKMVPVIVMRNKTKTNRYLASNMDVGDWEDPDLDVDIKDIENAYMIWRDDLSIPDESDVENVRKFSEVHKKHMIDKFGSNAIISFDFDEILKVYEPENIEISRDRFEFAKTHNEDENYLVR